MSFVNPISYLNRSQVTAELTVAFSQVSCLQNALLPVALIITVMLQSAHTRLPISCCVCVEFSSLLQEMLDLGVWTIVMVEPMCS